MIPFCACGHEEIDHDADGSRCLATKPGRCSCAGYRLATRARGAQPDDDPAPHGEHLGRYAAITAAPGVGIVSYRGRGG